MAKLLRRNRWLQPARLREAVLRRNIILLGLFAVLTGLALTYLLARNIMRPVETNPAA